IGPETPDSRRKFSGVRRRPLHRSLDRERHYSYHGVECAPQWCSRSVGGLMAYRNKTYIAFDGDSDIRYYRLMKAWSANEHFDFEFHDAHDLNTARDSSQ